MKSKFTRPAAFAAAALLIIGAAAPAFAVKAEANQDEAGDSQNAFEFISDNWNWFYKKYIAPPEFIPLKSHGTYEVPPHWNAEMAMQQDKPVNKSDVQPGEYYIYKTEDRVFNTIYSLIKIDEIYEKGGVFGYGTTRTAKYTQERMNSSGEISLDKARLYEVLPLACEESHPDLLFTPEGRSYPCDRYGIPFWSDSMCDEHPIDQNSVRPGRYYIYRTYDRHLNHIYSLIKIDEIYNKERPWNLPPEKAAKYTPANGGDSGEIYLSIACLYEVPSYSSGEDRDELPEWDESMCNERIDPYDLQPGRYYICMTYIRDQAEPFNKIYRLAKVNDVFDSQICPELSGEEYAEIEFPETGIKRQISLNPAKYDSYLDRYYFYEIPD